MYVPSLLAENTRMNSNVIRCDEMEPREGKRKLELDGRTGGPMV